MTGATRKRLHKTLTGRPPMKRTIPNPFIISLFALPSIVLAQDYSVLSCEGLKPVIIENSADMDGLSVYMQDEKLFGTAQSDGSWFVMNEAIAAQYDGQSLRILSGRNEAIHYCSEIHEAIADAAVELAKQLAKRAIASEREMFEKYLRAVRSYERELAYLNAEHVAGVALLNENIDSLKKHVLTLEKTAEISPEEIADLRVSVTTLTQDLNAALSQMASQEAELARVYMRLRNLIRQNRETRGSEQLTETEARDPLLAQAKAALADQEAISLKAQREAELLNQQITALNQQLDQLQALLDTRIAEDSRNKIQMATLGQDLNTALAQVAAQKAELARLAEARAAALEARNATLEGYQSEFFGRMREALADVEGLRIEGDRFVFDSAVLFESGSATVSFAGANEIKAVADTLKLISQEIPNEIEWVIQVDGHTDNVPVTAGPFENNWELSQARALSVVQLLALVGIPPDRLSANGFGEHQPIDTADTPEARASNRRIELRLLER